jgi:hypothetical protein
LPCLKYCPGGQEHIYSTFYSGVLQEEQEVILSQVEHKKGQTLQEKELL